MPEVRVRKKIITAEEILHEGGPDAAEPTRRAAALAVIANPFAGGFVEDIAGMMEDLKPLGLEMSRQLLDALEGDPALIESYGKGVIVGEGGESEHGALWHVPGGYAMRELLGDAERGEQVSSEDHVEVSLLWFSIEYKLGRRTCLSADRLLP